MKTFPREICPVTALRASAVLAALLVACICLSLSSARAQCIDPPGEAGVQVYNSTHNVMQYCDGNKWIGMAGGGNGGTLGALPCTAGQIAQYDGTDWACVAGMASKVDKAGDTMGGALTVPAPAAGPHIANRTYVDAAMAGVLPACNIGESPIKTAGGWGCVELGGMTPGYFILSDETTNGNFGGMDGAHALCLAKLQAKDWKGKDNSTLTPATVRAFLCDDSNACGDLQPSTEYFFARMGDANVGGASIVSDSSGSGPGDANAWNGPTYWGTSDNFWTGRGSGSASKWPVGVSSGNTCNSWTHASITNPTGRSGLPDRTNTQRWNQFSEYCSSARRYACIVHPGVPPVDGGSTPGYFILSDAGKNADFGGWHGAKRQCLLDLKSRDWMGKDNATVNSTTVKPFLCTDEVTDPSICGDLLPNAEYKFAVMGSPATGGAAFTTDGTGRGPGDGANWSGSTYFDGNYTYWTNRKTTGTATLWPNDAGGVLSCVDWTGTSAFNWGGVGTANNTNANRWTGSSPACNSTTPRYICVVDPGDSSSSNDCTYAGGVEVGGACWFAGDANESCITVCTRVNSTYNAATLSFAGSGGSNANCQSVLEALQMGGSGTPGTASAAYGCGRNESSGARVRGTTATTDNAANANVHRACACNPPPMVPVDCTTGPIGTVCTSDGAIYIGNIASARIYARATDSSTSVQWKVSNTDTTGTSGKTDGTVNTDAMIADTNSSHPVATLCRSHGAQWYVPAEDELNLIWQNSAANGGPLDLAGMGINTTGNYYWSSSQSAIVSWARTQQFSGGAKNNDSKIDTGKRARCVRREGGGGSDTTPDAFSFNDVTGAPTSTLTTPTPATVTITGINASTLVSVSGNGSPQISINGGSWVTSGTITNDQTLAVRLTSAASGGTAYVATIDVGGVTDNWSVTTAAADTTPDAFSFNDVSDTPTNTLTTPTPPTVTITGINAATSVSISGQGSPQISINGGSWLTSGTITNGQTLAVRLISGSPNGTVRTATIDVGGVTDVWSVTAFSDGEPDAFSFNDRINVPLNTLLTPTPATVTITGINYSVPVSVNGAVGGSPQISINGGPWVTSGTISNGQTLAVRITSASTHSTMRRAAITVGGSGDYWDVTTIGPPCAGELVGGYCWYLGASNKSCDETCASHGGCNLTGTKDYAGSAGTNANCKAVLDALSGSGSAVSTQNGSKGCTSSITRIRETTFNTDCSSKAMLAARACACNN